VEFSGDSVVTMGKTAILFPGQGAQVVGMGKDFAAQPAAARIYERAAQVLGWDVAALCFNGPQAELDRTVRCQPAILTTSIAIVEALKASGSKALDGASAAAGLSLGEYSALVMSGALDFEDALRLVQKRGQYMEEACAQNPGTMMSVLGLEDGIVEAICAQARETAMVVAANYNSPGQVVISGTREGTERAAALAKERGAKRVLPLAVSGAFHSPLMEPAAARLEAELAATALRAPALTLVANVTAQPVADPEDIRRALARQVKSPVLWSQSVQWLLKDGVTNFVEIGPGKVLSGLMKRTAPEAPVVNISSADALKA
jgi:[acyl-carrier-protein] S-malonyltransferase